SVKHIEEITRTSRSKYSTDAVIGLENQFVAQVKRSLEFPAHAILQRQAGPKLPVILEGTSKVLLRRRGEARGARYESGSRRGVVEAFRRRAKQTGDQIEDPGSVRKVS